MLLPVAAQSTSTCLDFCAHASTVTELRFWHSALVTRIAVMIYHHSIGFAMCSVRSSRPFIRTYPATHSPALHERPDQTISIQRNFTGTRRREETKGQCVAGVHCRDGRLYGSVEDGAGPWTMRKRIR